MMAAVARFGDNLRSVRKSLGLSQKQLAGRLSNEDGTEMQQANVSKLEAKEWAPKPETVQRLAEGLSRISGQSIQAEFDRLLDGVSSRHDAVLAQRADTDPIDRLRSLIDQLPADRRPALVDALERYAMESLKAFENKGA
jgi:transcriptional regulator with XRE-family HTH domain